MKKYITVDGNTAAANMAYALSDMAIIYPITPSSPMAENIDEWQAAGKLNCFGNKVSVTEMQSEAGAAGALHGALTSGALATTFTSSQGLLLMIPNMYKIAGELLPCVINVAARTLATHALSIFGDHSDVMACRATGFAMLSASSVQEAQDMALASYLTTINSRVPFLHFFDGFRTSHEINKIEEIDYDTIKTMINYDAIQKFKASAISSDNPTQRGTAQNGDVFFQNREASNTFYNQLPTELEKTFDLIAEKTGRKYKLFDYYGAKDATDIIVAMGSSTETIKETIDYLVKTEGRKVGVVVVHLFRPFSTSHLLKTLPKTTERITVLDRTKESGAIGEPLYTDVCSSLFESGITGIKVIGGRYGLSSKNFDPDQVLAIYDNMASNKPKNHFTVGITDDVTNTSIPVKKHINTLPKGTIECKFFGLGSDGTVSANKNSIKIIGENTSLYSQAYFVYDSKKSGSITTSHLRFGEVPIRSTYLCTNADFIACHNPTYVKKFDCLHGIKDHGIFLLNAPWTKEEMEHELPASMKQTLAKKHLKVYVINANAIAKEVGLNNRINTIMQACFFKLTNIIPWNVVSQKMKDAVVKTYSKKGDAVVQMNIKAIDSADGHMWEFVVPENWKNATTGANVNSKCSDPYFNSVIEPIISQSGDNLPVSAFTPNGEVPTGTTALEKRDIATTIPMWIPENCIQCNQCALVCPHGCIRPYLPNSGSEESKKVGAKPAMGIAGKDFVIQCSPMDCTSCENCVNTCPAKNKALVMVDKETYLEKENEKYNIVKDIENEQSLFKANTVKGSQFKQPLFEFSGACAGCGETPYVKLLTQLFGDHMIIANATGCSSIYGGSNPTCPYTKNKKGQGPAWSNSLFEDNAEFGLGMFLAHKKNTQSLVNLVKNGVETIKKSENLNKALTEWLNGNRSDDNRNTIIELCKTENTSEDAIRFAHEIIALNSCLTEKTFWILGGDGWAYDIGYGGLDHVLSSNENIKVLVLDTEVYSNTGGQASKSTPLGSVAKFAASGKRTHKKDLGAIAMNYPNCYVASCSMGANPAQTIQALTEAENHNGPAIVIVYAPCINHGINMSKTQETEKNAVLSGYWPLYRFDPTKENQPLTIDPPFKNADYKSFTDLQSRYFILTKKDPQKAEELIHEADLYRQARLNEIKKLND